MHTAKYHATVTVRNAFKISVLYNNFTQSCLKTRVLRVYETSVRWLYIDGLRGRSAGPIIVG